MKNDQIFHTIYIETVVIQGICSQNSDVSCVVTELMVYDNSVLILCRNGIEGAKSIHFGHHHACSAAKQKKF